MAPNKTKDYCKRISKNDWSQKTNNQNFYVLPPRVSIPLYRVPNELRSVVLKNLEPYPDMSKISEQYLTILRNIIHGNLQMDKDNYLQILKLMLHVEHIQNQLDMKRYDQNNKKIERISKLSNIFKIYVDNLGEDRPSIRPEDDIEIRESNTTAFYLLKVINVAKDYILAAAKPRFSINFHPDALYNIRFRWPDYTMRCSHYAISLTSCHQLSHIFFPKKSIPYVKTGNNDYWFNTSVENNPQQKQAVLNIVCKSSFPVPYILYGPPGTGKTATLVEAICQIYNNSSCDTHILVCTPSNSAADEITRRLLNYISDISCLHRMYSPSKDGSKIESAIIGCSNYVDGQVFMLPEEAIKTKAIILCTLCAVTRLLFMGFKEKHFSYVFIDEAGQATEPDSLIPFNLLTSTKEGRVGRLHGQVVIAGDPMQLGPSVRSKLAEPILGQSLMERLMGCEPYRKNEHNMYNPSFITKLVRNYRSHTDIIHVSNELFYESELIPCAGDGVKIAENWSGLQKRNFPIIFHGVEGVELREERSPSIYNNSEIKVVVNYVRNLIRFGLGNGLISQRDIGVITPFAQQRIKLHKAFEQIGLHEIDVGTVELFQGQERNVIIMSTVRSEIYRHDARYHIGFLSNPKRFNVALTRAKALLIVVGDPNILKVDPYWRYFLQYCMINNACCGVPFNIEESVDQSIKHMYHEKKRTKESRINCDLSVIKIDDGVIESSNENDTECLTTSTNLHYSVTNQAVNNVHGNNENQRSNNHSGYGNTASTSNNLLFNIVMQKLQQVEIDGSENEKKKKNKNKK